MGSFLLLLISIPAIVLRVGMGGGLMRVQNTIVLSAQSFLEAFIMQPQKLFHIIKVVACGNFHYKLAFNLS